MKLGEPQAATSMKAPLSSARVRRAMFKLRFVPLFAVVAVVYVFFVSAGHWSHWPLYGTFHDLQAEAFRAGQLYLPLTPAPELLRAANPYDIVNGSYWVWDASYFKGRFYAYWGPVPALLWALTKSVLGVRGVIGDQYVGFAFMLLSACLGALLIDRLARRLLVRAPRWAVWLAAATFAFAHPALHAAATASTYHAAIAAAQAFALGAILTSFDAVYYARTERARLWRFALAGTWWALAIASRVSMAPTAAIIALFTAFAANGGLKGAYRYRLAALGLEGLPVLVAVFGLLLYNELRFDNWFEFGTHLQLSVYPFKLSASWVLPNLYSYLLRPGRWSCRFPYVYQIWEMKGAFPEWFELPRGYLVNEPVVGWLRIVPITWLAPLAFVFAPRFVRRSALAGRAYLFCLAAFLVLGTVTGLLVIGLYMATMRYQNDVLNGLVLLGLVGGLALLDHPLNRVAPRVTAAVFALPAVVSIVFGVLLGYQGYNAHFRLFNPALDAKIVGALSVCGDELERAPAFSPAP